MEGGVGIRRTEPIKSRDEILKLSRKLRKKRLREYLVFMLVLTTGLRVSDVLKLKVCQIRSSSVVMITEQKTNKRKEFKLSKKLYNQFLNYCKNKRDYEYIFRSREGRNKHITRQTFYIALNKAIEEHYNKKISSHVLRKCFAYHALIKTKDIALVSLCLNHSAVETTIQYLGLNQDEINKTTELIAKEFNI